jgi:hypothetical protein
MDQFLFPRLFIRSMGLIFVAGAKADARNTVPTHDGNTIGRKCPLVKDRFFVKQASESLRQGRAYGMILSDPPGWEVGVGRIYKTGIRRSFIRVHGYFSACRFYRREIFNLPDSDVGVFPLGEPSVYGDPAAIGYGAS